MNRHLVAVEVRVKRRTNEGVNFYRASLYEHGLECLYGETVKGGSTVQKNGVFLYNIFQYVPNEGFSLFYEFFHYERLKELYRHFFGKSALIEFEFGAYDDNRTARIVYTFAEEVLTETPLLAAEHTRKRFKFAVGRTRKRLAAPAVVYEGVDRLLQHTLFVFNDHIGSAELHHTLQTVVAVYNPAVQIVKVGGSESSAVELNHGTDIGGKHGKHR